ncbi:LysR family transcriptional regulator [Rhodospirillum rubrum]|nr:LysR family transcriptional regulator [Rhodospirillum rubrum]MBK1675150.1 LysR family transcriptional regulator [Rhodospirillum rubrum]
MDSRLHAGIPWVKFRVFNLHSRKRLPMPPAPRPPPPLSDIDIRLLKVFRKVAECGGFSAAEVELNIGRAAISLHMADLERRLGLRLCRRGRAGFLLTDEGKRVLDATLRLLAALESFRAEINAVHSSLRGDLAIGITDNLVTLPRMRVTDALRALKHRAPEVRVSIRMIPPNEIERGVLDGRLQVGVVPCGRRLPGLNEVALYDEDSRLFCGEGHPLFALPEAAVSAAQVAAADAVAPTLERHGAAETLHRGLKVTATATDREGVAFLVLTGCYLGFLPTHYARQWVERGVMRALLPQTHHYSVEFAAITRKGGHPNLVLETFLGLLLGDGSAP